MNALTKVEPPFAYSIPDFSCTNLQEGTKADDFNDLISIYGLSVEDVKTQLNKEQHRDAENFFAKLGRWGSDNRFRQA